MSITAILIGMMLFTFTGFSIYVLGYAVKHDSPQHVVAGALLFGLTVFFEIRLLVIPNGILTP